MADGGGTKLSKAQLKEDVRAIILLQGNDFIKELLRTNELKIGVTKADFTANIAKAIDDGDLTQSMIEQWLFEIEGWGNQHVYMFDAPSCNPATMAGFLNKSTFAHLVGISPSYNFPNELELSNILHDSQSLSLIWHVGKEAWDRTKSRDERKVVGLDLYRLDAYRQRLDRSVVRFEWRFGDSHCAIFIHRNQELDHGTTKNVVWTTLQSLSIVPEPCPLLSLTLAVKSASKLQGTKSARLEAEGGFVDLVSTLENGGIDKVAAVRHTRNAMKDDEFDRAQGVFSLGEAEKLSQPLSVQVLGSEGRIRIWAQCTRKDVHAIIGYLLTHNVAPSHA